MKFPNLWSTEGKIDRGPYAIVGLVGFAIKHNFDRLAAWLVFHRPWRVFNYWIPVSRAVQITSLPFIWVGVALAMQRLRAMGLAAWLVVLFFAPYVNLLFFLILRIYPSESAEDLRKTPRARENRTLKKIIPESNWGSAA